VQHAIGRASVPHTPTGTIYTPDLMSDATIGLFQSLSSAVTVRQPAIPTQRRPELPAAPAVRSADCFPWCPTSCVPDEEIDPALTGWGHLHRRELTEMVVADGDSLDRLVHVSIDLEAYTADGPTFPAEAPSAYVAIGPQGDTTEAIRLTPAEVLQLSLELMRAYNLLTNEPAPDQVPAPRRHRRTAPAGPVPVVDEQPVHADQA